MLFAFTLCFDLDASKSVVAASLYASFFALRGRKEERKRIKKIEIEIVQLEKW